MLQVVLDAGWMATVYPMESSRADGAAALARFPAGVTFLRGREEGGLRRLMRENIGTFDVVLISRPTAMEKFLRIDATLPEFVDRTCCIYDAEAVYTAREGRRRALFEAPMSEADYVAALDDEVGLAGRARAVITVTEAEARHFRGRMRVPVHVIGYPATVRSDPPGFAGRRDLLFVGQSQGSRRQSPNVDSLLWFIEEVMPRLDALLDEDYRLVIAGFADEALVSRLASERVVFVGVVDQLAPWYDRCRVFVAPTRYAAGLPLKLVDAAAGGIPCVMTDLLAEQVDMHDGVECTVAEDAASFASGCAALYRDPALWERIRDAASTRIAHDHSSDVFAFAIRRVLHDAVAAPVSQSTSASMSSVVGPTAGE